MQKRVKENPKIRTIMNYKVSRWLGTDNSLRGAELKSTIDESIIKVCAYCPSNIIHSSVDLQISGSV